MHRAIVDDGGRWSFSAWLSMVRSDNCIYRWNARRARSCQLSCGSYQWKLKLQIPLATEKLNWPLSTFNRQLPSQ